MEAKIISKNGGHDTINLNRRKAIRQRCLNCRCWEVQSVNNCEHNDCDLYPFRTGRGKQNAKDRTKAIMNYCRWCTNGHISQCGDSHCTLYLFRKSKLDSSIISTSFLQNGNIESHLNDKKESPDIIPIPVLNVPERHCIRRILL
jgi:hypothetical protein